MLTLKKIKSVISSLTPLVSGNKFEHILLETPTDADRAAISGGMAFKDYKSPHILIPYISDGKHSLLDIGYRTEEFCVELTKLGIGTCYIGELGREDILISHFGLPAGARIGSVLFFGYPTENFLGKVVDNSIRSLIGSKKRIPLDELCVGCLPESFSEILEVAQVAPSAKNVQPWRFKEGDGKLQILSPKTNPGYSNQEYKYFDVGICMSNISMLLREKGVTHSWKVNDGVWDEEMEIIAELIL